MHGPSSRSSLSEVPLFLDTGVCGVLFPRCHAVGDGAVEEAAVIEAIVARLDEQALVISAPLPMAFGEVLSRHEHACISFDGGRAWRHNDDSGEPYGGLGGMLNHKQMAVVLEKVFSSVGGGGGGRVPRQEAPGNSMVGSLRVAGCNSATGESSFSATGESNFACGHVQQRCQHKIFVCVACTHVPDRLPFSCQEMCR